MLDNAIEGCEHTDKPYIKLNIEMLYGYICIRVENKIDRSVLNENKNLTTTKSNKHEHGMGILHIKQICKKYNGVVNIYEKDMAFIAEAMLLMSCAD